MNRVLVFGIAMFIAIVGIALMGSDKQAQAGHGCKCSSACSGDCGGCDAAPACCGKKKHHRKKKCCGCAEPAPCCAPACEPACAPACEPAPCGCTGAAPAPAAAPAPVEEAPAAPAPAASAGAAKFHQVSFAR